MASRLFSCISGLFILLGAVLKIVMMFSDPLWESNTVFPTLLLVIAVPAEVIGGMLLFLSNDSTCRSFLALTIHLVFCIFGIWMYLIGENCNCMGTFEIDSWIILGANIFLGFIHSFLVFQNWKPIKQLIKETVFNSVHRRPNVVGVLSGSFVLLTLTMFFYGTIQGRELFEGDRFKRISTVAANVTNGKIGKVSHGNILLTNSSLDTVEITSGAVGCQCVQAVTKLPIVLKPSETISFELSITPYPTTKKKITKHVVFFGNVEGKLFRVYSSIDCQMEQD